MVIVSKLGKLNLVNLIILSNNRIDLEDMENKHCPHTYIEKAIV